MIIICNGSFKSGSTWLYLIIEEMLILKKISYNLSTVEEWKYKNKPNFLFSESIAKVAIPYYSNMDAVYLSKIHLLNESTYEYLENKSLNFKIIFSKRILEDALVSHFHHIKTELNLKIPFFLYYWIIGRYKAIEINSFEENKKKFLPEALMISFEELKYNFEYNVKKIAQYLDLEISNSEILLIKERTNIGNLKERVSQGKIRHYSTNSKKASKHFRKGEVGDSVHWFTECQKKDLNKIIEGKRSKVTSFLYDLLFIKRRNIYKI